MFSQLSTNVRSLSVIDPRSMMCPFSGRSVPGTVFGHSPVRIHT
jgi:hypothetical protein